MLFRLGKKFQGVPNEVVQNWQCFGGHAFHKQKKKRHTCIITIKANMFIFCLPGHQLLEKNWFLSSRIPSINSANPVMSLVAFLAAEVVPIVAASCANATLSVSTRDDSSVV